MQKYFTEKQIYASTFFGGPIPAGILIYKNFKRLGDDKKALLTIIFTLFFTCVLFYGLMQMPDEVSDKLPNILFTTLYTGIVYLIYHKYLAENINEKIVSAENKVSNWNVTGLTILGLIANLLIIFAIAFSEPVFPGEKIEFGTAKHEIFFDKKDINKSDLEAIGQILTDIGYFTNDVVQAIRIEKSIDNYVLMLPFQKESWNNDEFIAALNELKQTLYIRTGKKINLLLIHYELTGETLTKEF